MADRSCKVVYLAGPINGKSDDECKGWRDAAAETLRLFGHQVLDPMSRDYRGREEENAEKIVEGDKEDIATCHVVLVNANGPSWGTAMELVYASQYGKEVVAFATHCNSPRISPWLRMHTTAIYQSLSHALAAINQGSSAGMR